MRNLVALVALWLLTGSVAFAQETKVEIDGYYSYFRFNPENSGTLNSHSLNGGGGDVAFYFSNMIGIKAEFAGYQSSTGTYSSPTFGTASASANLFTYNVGPIFKFRSKSKPRAAFLLTYHVDLTFRPKIPGLPTCQFLWSKR